MESYVMFFSYEIVPPVTMYNLQTKLKDDAFQFQMQEVKITEQHKRTIFSGL